MIQQVRLLIKGKVQGVWYRKSTKIKADELGVQGTVQNLSDGSVEVFAVGEQIKIDWLIDWAWQGPKFAVVDSVIVNEIKTPQQFLDFQIIR
jgi:acylphosphatase